MIREYDSMTDLVDVEADGDAHVGVACEKGDIIRQPQPRPIFSKDQ